MAVRVWASRSTYNSPDGRHVRGVHCVSASMRGAAFVRIHVPWCCRGLRPCQGAVTVRGQVIGAGLFTYCTHGKPLSSGIIALASRTYMGKFLLSLLLPQGHMLGMPTRRRGSRL
eukprot:7226510-Pyramimonas_sp.AAC.3